MVVAVVAASRSSFEGTSTSWALFLRAAPVASLEAPEALETQENFRSRVSLAALTAGLVAVLVAAVAPEALAEAVATAVTAAAAAVALSLS